jgi:nitronate monooxygenase
MGSQGLPTIIQGGMGVAVSNWLLARTVSLLGQLGVVSGTAMDVVLVRRLQLGDPGGHMRRALQSFPLPDMAKRILDRYYVPEGKLPDASHAAVPMLRTVSGQQRLELLVVSNYVEVTLAKEGHDGLVGINYLEKIQLHTLPSLFGALIAGVDYVLMGAGIPISIPGIIEQMCEGNAVDLPLHVVGAGPSEKYCSRFDPQAFTQGRMPWLERPKFLPIVASVTLATMLSRKSTGKIDGFVVEGPTAGGHNAPPRDKSQFNDRGEPVYGERDVVDLEAMGKLGLPFWLAGSYGSPEQVRLALEAGAAGVQIGTAFAFCNESGLQDSIKREVIRRSRLGDLDVLTDPVASPAGFPFKVLGLDGTLSDQTLYEERRRCCDLGFLRHPYRKEDGTLGWRCPAEPVDTYLAKGGTVEETVGRKCICNGLFSNIGLAQVNSAGEAELPLITCGNDVNQIHRFLPTEEATSYSASDVIQRLLSGAKVPAATVACV